MKIRNFNRYAFSLFLFVCFYGLTLTVNAQNGTFTDVKFEGILTEETGPSICFQGGFSVRDCSGNILVRIEDSGASVNPLGFTGQFVRVEGVDVGVECPVLRINRIRAIANRCIAPQQPTIRRKEGIVGQTAGGDFVLRDCSGNTIFQLQTTRQVTDLAPFVGSFVRLKGNVPAASQTDLTPNLKVRTVIIKTNECPVVTPTARQ